MANFEDYADKYRTIRMERRDGILQATFHSRGGSLKWGNDCREEVFQAFADIGSDIENKVVILTGTGDDYCTEFEGVRNMRRTTRDWDDTFREGRKLIMNLLDIEVPMISAVNGPVYIHAMIPVLCDVVLATENAAFSDEHHFADGVVPGDGVHVVWPLLLGTNRAKYFMLTGQRLSAREALDLGVVNEILPRERLLPRAWELAEQFAQRPPLTLRYSRVIITHQLKRLMQDMLGYGLGLEGLGYVDRSFADE